MHDGYRAELNNKAPYECICGAKFPDPKALDGHVYTQGAENLRRIEIDSTKQEDP